MNNFRLLGIDFGERRIGLALTDETGLISSPYKTLDLNKINDPFAELTRIIKNKNIQKIIVGNPLSVDGSDSRKSEDIKKFIEKLSQMTEIDIELWDETGTTQKAKKILSSSNKKLKGNKDKLDKISASLILEDYLKYQQ